MDPNLHQKQGLNHLRRVLDYAPMVAHQSGEATVHLTREDWHVLADTLFQMDTPKDFLPDEVESYRLVDDNSSIEVKTRDYTIMVDVI